MIETQPLCASSSNFAHVNHSERMNFIDVGGHRSKVKATMGIIDKCGVCRDATLCVVIFVFGSIL